MTNNFFGNLINCLAFVLFFDCTSTSTWCMLSVEVLWNINDYWPINFNFLMYLSEFLLVVYFQCRHYICYKQILFLKLFPYFGAECLLGSWVLLVTCLLCISTSIGTACLALWVGCRCWVKEEICVFVVYRHVYVCL